MTSKVASAHFIGGRNWRVSDVFWGTPGARGKAEMLGYLASFDGKGRPTGPQIEERATDVGALNAIYCLNAGTEVVYVGEGVLASRLRKHAQEDAFARKWDTFSRLAPASYTFAPKATPKASVKQEDLVLWSPTSKRFVEVLELVAVQFGMPIRNKQEPKLEPEIAWLVQFRSKKCGPSFEEMLETIYQQVMQTGVSQR